MVEDDSDVEEEELVVLCCVVDAVLVEDVLVVEAGASTEVTNDSATENIEPIISFCATTTCTPKRTSSICREAILST